MVHYGELSTIWSTMLTDLFLKQYNYKEMRDLKAN